jgi:hypothetical protein
MASWIDEEYPEGMVGGAETALDQQKGQIKGKKTPVIATQRITETNPGLSRFNSALTFGSHGVDVRLGQ